MKTIACSNDNLVNVMLRIVLAATAGLLLCCSPLDSVKAADQQSDARADYWAGPAIGAFFDRRHIQERGHTLGIQPALLATMNAGYHWQQDHLVAGVEGELTAGEHGKLNGALRARAGISFSRALIYVSAGVAMVTDHTIGARPYFTYLSDMPRIYGPTFGGGAEIALSPTMALRGEVNTTRFQHASLVFPGYVSPVGAVQPPVREIFKFNDVSFRVGLMIRPGDGRFLPEQGHRTDWSGFYSGVSFGYVMDRNQPVGYDQLPAVPTVMWDQKHFAGAGVHIGHLWSLGSILIGPEAKVRARDFGLMDAAAGLRIGVPVNGVLIYGNIGRGFATATLVHQELHQRVKARHQGMTFGFGAESMISSSTSLRLEASAFDGQNATYSFNGGLCCPLVNAGTVPPPVVSATQRSVPLYEKSLSVGLTYHFK